MSFIRSGFSAIGRLGALALLAATFLIGLVSVVYMSLQGSEVSVPEITGKALSDGEKELASLGLKVKKRADRFSAEQPGTVIEQLPKAGETVKTGQLILVVTSKGPGEGGTPSSLKNRSDEDDSEKIEEMISEKPRKPKANSNTNRKKADTRRDVNAPANGQSDSNSSSSPGSNSNSSSTNSNKREPGGNNNSSDKPNRNGQTPPPGRVPNPTTKPGDTRQKRPQP